MHLHLLLLLYRCQGTVVASSFPLLWHALQINNHLQSIRPDASSCTGDMYTLPFTSQQTAAAHYDSRCMVCVCLSSKHALLRMMEDALKI